jgi:hypothetical protein
MRPIVMLAAIAASLAPLAAARAEPRGPRVGDIWETTLTQDSSERSDEGSSGSSHDEDVLMARVIGVRADGLELEYDLPAEATAEQRGPVWQFPARIFKPSAGPMTLLNRSELEARAEAWLKAAKLPREACGRWYFTWNAFQVECDPDSVIETVAQFDPAPPDLREGAPYRATGAAAPAPLARKRAGPEGTIWAAELAVDPEAVRRSRAEADVILGEIMNAPVSLEAALRKRAQEAVSGTVSVTFDTDPEGNVRRRTTITRVEIKGADGRSETRTTSQILERRRLRDRGQVPVPVP